jgi:hypothetical protein
MQTMQDLYFHCSDATHVLIDHSGIAVSNLSEAFAHADGLVRGMLMTANTEDWRSWELHVTDELGCEIFAVPFASVLGKLN